MSFWPWSKHAEDIKVSEVLATERQTHSELLHVVNELESLVARLSSLPEVRAARKTGRRKGETGHE